MHSVSPMQVKVLATYLYRKGDVTMHPRLTTSSLKLSSDAISMIVANGAGHSTQSVFITMIIWKMVMNWLQTMDTKVKVVVLMFVLSRAMKHQSTDKAATPILRHTSLTL